MRELIRQRAKRSVRVKMLLFITVIPPSLIELEIAFVADGGASTVS